MTGRAARDLPSHIAGCERLLNRMTAAFALHYAEVVVSDFEALHARRPEVERALGLSNS